MEHREEVVLNGLYPTTTTTAQHTTLCETCDYLESFLVELLDADSHRQSLFEKPCSTSLLCELCFSSTNPGTLLAVLGRLLAQKTDLDNPGRLVIEAAHGNAPKVRDLVQKFPDKASNL